MALKIRYQGELAIFHTEAQSGKDENKEIDEYYSPRQAVERLIPFGVMLNRTTTIS